MSTNFYFDLKLGDSRNHASVTYRMHIGKATGSGNGVYGLSTVCGSHFPDVESWIKFLRHNSDAGIIRDEYGAEQDTEEFIAEYLESDAPTSERQINWLREHENDPLYGGDHTKIWDEPQPDTWRGRHWIDQKSGKLFLSGEFF